jgi:hypothetical protein
MIRATIIISLALGIAYAALPLILTWATHLQ